MDHELLEQMESELRRRLTTRDDARDARDDPLDAYQTLLKESMDDVATLMREVQHELSLIRAEERRFKSLSAQSLLHLSRSSAPILDTLSIDGQLPFCTLTAGGHSAHALPFESLSIASMMTSSEVSRERPHAVAEAPSGPAHSCRRRSVRSSSTGGSSASEVSRLTVCRQLYGMPAAGQPRYVHKHCDGVRVDDCETRFLSKVRARAPNRSDPLSRAGLGRRARVAHHGHLRRRRPGAARVPAARALRHVGGQLRVFGRDPQIGISLRQEVAAQEEARARVGAQTRLEAVSASCGASRRRLTRPLPGTGCR